MRTILRGLSIRQKLLAISLLFIFPLGVLLYFTISSVRSDIHFTEMEKHGLRMLRPLEELMQLVPRHRSLAFLQSRGKKELDPELRETANRINSTLAVLVSEAALVGNLLKLDDESLRLAEMDDLRPANLKESWDRLHANKGELIPEMSDLEHSNIITMVRRLIARVGDTSNLILDPELSSYYMVEITLNEIPRILDYIGELTLLGQQILCSGEPGAQDLSRLALLTAAIDKGSLLQMQNSLATAARYERQAGSENTNAAHEAEKAFQKSFDSTRYLLQLAQVLHRPDKTGSLLEFAMLGSTTVDFLGKFRDQAFSQLESLLNDRITRHKQKMYIILLLTFSCLSLAAILVFIISRGITRPLGKVMDIAGEIAAGNLDQARLHAGRLTVDPIGAAELPGVRDEIWQLASVFVHMTHSLHSLVLQVHRSGIQVLASTTEISASSRQMEATAAQQASSTNQVSVTAREISSSCKLLLESVQRVLAVASETLSLAREGQNRLSRMQSKMGALTKATSSIASQLDGISRTTGGIGSVVTTMTKVADQTNLLSLNATIEAEKAGKFGLGFSVVAREIQRLADQTAVSTLDIENLVREMGATVSAGVTEMDEFVNQVRETMEEVETISSVVVSSIVDHLHELLPRFEELGGAMNAQSTGAEEISKAMNQLSEGAEQTRRVIHDFGNVTKQLISAAAELREEVSRFKAQSAPDER